MKAIEPRFHKIYNNGSIEKFFKSVNVAKIKSCRFCQLQVNEMQKDN